MKKILLLTSLLLSTISISQVGAVWTSPTEGTIDGVPFTVTGVTGGSIVPYDLSTADFVAAPLSSSQQCLDYSGFYDITITLDSPVELYVYAKYWRTDTYVFSDPTTFLSGSNLTVVDAVTTDATSYADGVFKVNGLVTTFTLTSSFQGCCSYQAMNFGGLSCGSDSSIIVNACESYTVPSGDETYFTSGIYLDTIPNMAGCDSLLTIDVTINNPTITVTQVDAVTLSSDAIGAIYTWVDCDNAFAPLTGDTNQTMIATSNGNYAVIVEENGCIDTSLCTIIDQVGINKLQTNKIAVYPNPVNDVLTINFGDDTAEEIQVLDTYGKSVEIKRNSNSGIDVSALKAGVYFLNVKLNNEWTVLRFVKM